MLFSELCSITIITYFYALIVLHLDNGSFFKLAPISFLK